MNTTTTKTYIIDAETVELVDNLISIAETDHARAMRDTLEAAAALADDLRHAQSLRDLSVGVNAAVHTVASAQRRIDALDKVVGDSSQRILMLAPIREGIHEATRPGIAYEDAIRFLAGKLQAYRAASELFSRDDASTYEFDRKEQALREYVGGVGMIAHIYGVDEETVEADAYAHADEAAGE